MLRKIAFCSLLLGGFVHAAVLSSALAQSTAPSNSPKRGTSDYTKQIVKDFRKSQADYGSLCSSSTDLTALNTALKHTRSAWERAVDAIYLEIEAEPATVRAADTFRQAGADYARLKKSEKDYEAELKARDASIKARRAFDAVYERAVKRIKAANDVEDVSMPALVPCPQHQALLDAKKKAEPAAAAKSEKKDVATKAAAPKTVTGSRIKLKSCAPGNGLSGPLETLACQEGK